MHAIEAIGTLRQNTNLRGWLFIILRNIWFNQLRCRRVAPTEPERTPSQGTLDEKAAAITVLADASLHRLSSIRAAAHIPTFLSKRASSTRSANFNTAMVSSMSIACFWKARSIKLRPVPVSSTIRLRPSFGSDVLRSSFLDSRRSTAAVIEALVSRTFFPIVFTGSGPLCRSASNTAKSEWPRPKADTLRAAFSSIALAALHNTK